MGPRQKRIQITLRIRALKHIGFGFGSSTPAKVSGPTPSMESPFGFLGKNKSVEILKTPPHVRIALSASAECPSNDGRGFGSEEIPTAVEVQHIASVFGPERSRWFGAPFGTRSDGESPKRGRGDSELLGRSIDAWPSFTAPAASVSLTPPPSSFVDHAIPPGDPTDRGPRGSRTSSCS